MKKKLLICMLCIIIIFPRSKIRRVINASEITKINIISIKNLIIIHLFD